MAALREALRAAESEIEVWKAEAHPGLLTRIRRNLGLVGGTAAVTLLGALVIL